MSAIRLEMSVTTDPDFGGFRFYVEQGRAFDAGEYAEAYEISRGDISEQDIMRAEQAARNLQPGEWLEVTHEDE